MNAHNKYQFIGRGTDSATTFIRENTPKEKFIRKQCAATIVLGIGLFAAALGTTSANGGEFVQSLRGPTASDKFSVPVEIEPNVTVAPSKASSRDVAGYNNHVGVRSLHLSPYDSRVGSFVQSPNASGIVERSAVPVDVGVTGSIKSSKSERSAAPPPYRQRVGMKSLRLSPYDNR